MHLSVYIGGNDCGTHHYYVCALSILYHIFIIFVKISGVVCIIFDIGASIIFEHSKSACTPRHVYPSSLYDKFSSRSVWTLIGRNTHWSDLYFVFTRL